MKKILTFLILIISLNCISQQTYVLANKDTLVISSTTTAKTGTYTYTYPETVWTSVVKAYRPPIIIDTVVIPPVIIPGNIEGFGKTNGGNGQPVFHVSNATDLLNNIKSNRYIIIDKGGTYVFRGNYTNLVNLTIDGSQADGPVIINNNNNGGAMIFETAGCHDIIVKSIAIRNAGDDNAAVNLGGYRIVFDHCSFNNGGDGNVDITNSHDITIQWCILGNSVSGASLIDYPGTRNVSIHHNLYSSFERNPLIGSQQKAGRTDLVCDFTNNIVWKWSNFGTDVNNNGTANIVNNYYYSASKPTNAVLTANQSYGPYPQGFAYVAGNVSGSGIDLNKQSNHALWPVPVESQITTQDACAAAKLVLSNAGPFKKDPVDLDFIKQVTLPGCPAN